MKKTISTIFAILIISTLLCSCVEDATVTCDFCDTEYKESKGHTRNIEGEVIYICADCYEYMTEGLE
ncbi:MAG: hypothetical protein E7678_08180 [Ruminococcaceae bacterium]|nr:hypothetical protein [Oscillospiraceae bacterium]